ncbi:MAG: hypothetical protein IPP90_07015 [Gemmatimonadaceae bacterium]|nr:hypothetical protein [Gemmatimonadaceae bacterium]
MLPNRILFAVITLASAAIAVPTNAQTRDSAGVRIVENTQPMWSDVERLQLAATPRLVFGNTTDSAYRFSRIRGVMRLSDGRIAVADGGSLQLRFFDAKGQFLSASGGKGTAPGRPGEMNSAQLLRGDTIAITAGLSTLTRFSSSGQFVRTTDIPAPDRTSARGRQLLVSVLGNGTRVTMQWPMPSPRAPGTQWADSSPMRFYDERNAIIRDLGPLPYIELIQAGAQPTTAWLSPIGVFAGGDQRFYAGFGDRYAIHVFGADGALQSIIRRAWTPVPITPADWETWVVEWSKLWVRETGAEREKAIQKIREEPYAETVPAFSQFLVDRIGRLWVREAHWQDAIAAGSLSDPPAVPSTWSVFDVNGRWLGDVSMPTGFQPYDIGADYVAGKLRATDVNQVVIYALGARGRS